MRLVICVALALLSVLFPPQSFANDWRRVGVDLATMLQRVDEYWTAQVEGNVGRVQAILSCDTSQHPILRQDLPDIVQAIDYKISRLRFSLPLGDTTVAVILELLTASGPKIYEERWSKHNGTWRRMCGLTPR